AGDARVADAAGLVLRRPGRPVAQHRDGAGAVLHDRASVHFRAAAAREPLLAQARVRGGPVRGPLRRRRRPRARAGEALRGQRGDADPGPAAFGFLRLAPARAGAHRPAAVDARLGGAMTSLAQMKCKDLPSGTPPLSRVRIDALLKEVTGWSYDGKV